MATTTTRWHGSTEYDVCRIQQKSEAAVTYFTGHMEEMSWLTFLMQYTEPIIFQCTMVLI
jgi:hypothetical protein